MGRFLRNEGKKMSEYILEKGCPASVEGRLDKEIRVYDFLDRLGIDYERVDHPALMTMEACEAVDKVLDTRICKNLFLCNAQRTQFYLLLMPGDKKFKTAVLSKQIGSARLSFAEPEYMLEMLDITPGSVSVMGLMNDKNRRVRLLIDTAHKVQLLIDEDVLKEPVFACHPCINTSSLRFATRELTEKILPALGETVTTVAL